MANQEQCGVCRERIVDDIDGFWHHTTRHPHDHQPVLAVPLPAGAAEGPPCPKCGGTGACGYTTGESMVGRTVTICDCPAGQRFCWAFKVAEALEPEVQAYVDALPAAWYYKLAPWEAKVDFARRHLATLKAAEVAQAEAAKLRAELAEAEAQLVKEFGP